MLNAYPKHDKNYLNSDLQLSSVIIHMLISHDIYYLFCHIKRWCVVEVIISRRDLLPDINIASRRLSLFCVKCKLGYF